MDTCLTLRLLLLLLLQLLLCSLYEIYKTLEEEMDNNSDHPSVAPIYFPAELARLESIEKDLQYFFGQDWREKVVVPAATKRYCHRLRQVRLSLSVTHFSHTVGDMGLTMCAFLRLVKKILNTWWPTLTPATSVICLEVRFLVELPRSPWVWKAARVSLSLHFLAYQAPTSSNSFIEAAWTAWSWQRRRGTACWRRRSEPLSSTFRWDSWRFEITLFISI